MVSLLAGLVLAGPAWATSYVRPKVLPVTPVTAVNLQIGQANNSPELVADPKDPDFVAAASRIDGPTFSCSLQVSVDGGRIWAPSRPVPVLPPGAQRCYAPQIAFDGSGRLYYLFAGLAGLGNAPMGVFLTSSTDYGHSFSTPRRVLGAENYMVGMGIDRSFGSHGRIHLVWVSSSTTAPLGGFTPSDNPILASYSDNGGKTFSTPVRVSDPSRQRVVAPAMVLGLGHSIDVVYYDLGTDARDYEGLAGPTWTGPWSLVSSRSSDGGKTFGAGTMVDANVVPPGRVMLIYTMAPPALAIDPHGRLLVAWTDSRFSSADILFRRSLDGGRSWGQPLRLNDDPVGDGATQYLPQLSVAPNGRIDAIFLDRRNDPRNVYNETYYTYSADDGVRFAPNIRLTTRSSQSLVGVHYSIPSAAGLVEFGSRLGLLSTNSGTLATWPDTSNSLGGGDATGGPIAQDISSTEVAFSSSSSFTFPWTVVVVMAVGAVGLTAIGLVLFRRRGRRDHPVVRLRWLQVASAAAVVAGAAVVAIVVLGIFSSAPTTPVKTTVVNVSMAEYRYEFRSPTAPGRLIFLVHNNGRLPHQVSLLKLSPRIALPFSKQLHSGTRHVFAVVAYLPNMPPGASASFAVDLGPGPYGVVSDTMGKDGKNDSKRGMSSEFRLQ